MAKHQQFEFSRNNGEINLIADVRISGDGEKFRIDIRQKHSASVGISFVLDESEVHNMAQMFAQLAIIASRGFPED